MKSGERERKERGGRKGEKQKKTTYQNIKVQLKLKSALESKLKKNRINREQVPSTPQKQAAREKRE